MASRAHIWNTHRHERMGIVLICRNTSQIQSPCQPEYSILKRGDGRTSVDKMKIKIILIPKEIQ